MDAVEIDPNFEPQIRARSNTWPCRPREDFIEGQQTSPASDEAGSGDHVKDGLGLKKTSSRRNAWGNLSYADLITKAIQASPEQRLTLSQIYDWMVQNVPYFKDKGDSTSSAGWKNSIRHNLSLHSRFMRIQNEGTGKSSWWVLNPDAKPGKAPRRRAGSMETKNLEKKRGRLKKRVEAIRAAQENGTLASDDLLDLQYGFSLSPEFRARAGSNASSCGRLSPIQAAVEPDLHDGQVPPMSPIPWGGELDVEDSFSRSSDGFTLVDSLVGGLNLSESKNLGIVSTEGTDIEMLGSTIKPELMSGGSMGQYNNQNSFDEYGNLPAPPSYTDHMQQSVPQQTTVLDLDQNMGMQNRTYTNMATKQQTSIMQQPMFTDGDPYQVGLLVGQGLSPQQRMSSPVSNALGINTQRNSPGRSPQLSPSNYSHTYGGQMPSPQMLRRSPQQMAVCPPQQPQPQPQMADGRSLLQQCLEAPNDSLLRAALTQTSPPYQQQQQQQQKLVSQQQTYTQFNNIYSVTPMQTRPIATNLSNNVSMSQLMMNNAQNPLPQAMEASRNISNPSLADIDTDSMLDLDYDVEQLLRHELAIDANLDFAFDPNNPSSTSENHNFVR